MTKIRTRFAPSPTGKLHIGGARTALFCYLYAKNLGGEFLLRLEDTDIVREVKDGEKNLLDGLKWMGITPDYYPGHEDNPNTKFRQSEKLEVYKNYANELLKKGKAYKCFCKYDSNELSTSDNSACGSILYDANGNPFKTERKCKHNQNQSGEYAIRIEMDDHTEYKWNDLVRGSVSFSSRSIGDWVAIKANGIATYNFANPIDDIDMKITDVIRGEEHISNTPKQIHIYKEFGWELPKFSHLTVIVGSDGKKLSKRDEKVLQFIELYEQKGYLPEAVVNYLSLLGWSPKSEVEIFNLKELVEKFNIEGLSKAPSQFDLDKLKWYNNFYIKKMSFEECKAFLHRFMKHSILPESKIDEIIKLYQPSLREGIEIVEHINLFEQDKLIYTTKVAEEIKLHKSLLVSVKTELSKISTWTKDELLIAIKNIGTLNNVQGKSLMMPIRLALIGQEHGPDLSKTIEIFGKEKTNNLLNDAINL